MDKLLNVPGGMPVRTTDFELLQQAVADALKGILSSVGATTFILKGLAPSIGGGNITITEGWVYAQSEIFYVPAATFAYDMTKSLYLSQNVYQEEQRHFSDGHYHNCFERRRYALGYATEVPEGSIALDEITYINNLINNQVITALKVRQQTISSELLAFGANFTQATGCADMKVSKNEFGDCVLTAAFLCSDPASSLLCTLSEEFWPKGDLHSTFVKGDYTLGLMVVKSTGEVLVIGADDERPNFIRLQYNCIMTNTCENNIYDVPVAAMAPIVIEGGPFPAT